MEAGASSRRRSQSEGTEMTLEAVNAGQGTSNPAKFSKQALAQVQAHDAEATDKVMPLMNGDEVVVPRKSGRRWSVSGAENAVRRPQQRPSQQGINRSTTTGQLKLPSRGSSRASPVSPGSPAQRITVDAKPAARALMEGVREAFPEASRGDWLMADGELPGLTNPHRTAMPGGGFTDSDTTENGWHTRHGGPSADRHRAKSGPSAKLGRASSFRDELLLKRDSDQPSRRKAMFSQTNGDVEPFLPSAKRPTSATRRSTGDKPSSTLPAIPRSITSAGRARTQKSTPGSATGSSGMSAAGRPHTTVANGRRVSANSKISTTIDGLSDLPPDAVIHEVIRVLRNLRVEDWEPKGYETIHCTWFETQFEISVLEEAGMCSLSFERLSSSGSQLGFREACEQIISALRVYVGA